MQSRTRLFRKSASLPVIGVFLFAGKESVTTEYTIYQKIQDCNVAYNDTLDCVIDRIEEMIGEVQ